MAENTVLEQSGITSTVRQTTADYKCPDELRTAKQGRTFAPVDICNQTNRFDVEVATFTGAVLGTGKLGSAYRSNFGDLRRPIRFLGINGVEYFGTYFEGAGDYCRVRAIK